MRNLILIKKYLILVLLSFFDGMGSLFLFHILFCIFFRIFAQNLNPLETANELDAIEAANWALQHLRGMNDDGSYECLRLKEVISYDFKHGKHHDIIFLKVILFAPSDQEVGGVAESLLLGGVATSEHKVTVFTDNRDGIRSFSIDTFPKVRSLGRKTTTLKGSKSTTNLHVGSDWWPTDFELEGEGGGEHLQEENEVGKNEL